MKILYALGIGFLLWSCSSSTEKAAPTIDWDFVRVERSIAAVKTDAEVSALLNKYPEIKVGYFSATSKNSPYLAQDLFRLYANPALRKFYDQSQEAAFFGGDALEKELKEAFTKIQQEFPGVKTPKIRTIFSGFGGIGGGEFTAQNLVVSDSLIIVGLDFFMGSRGLYKAPNVYEYQLRKLEPKALVAQIILQYSAYLIKQTDNDVSLLSDMIWYGKGYVFTKTILPSVPDSLLFGYTQQEIAETNAFQREVWEHFIDNKLLFSGDKILKAKYLDERPKTTEIGPACPGGIGRWLGWRIVDTYWKQKPKISLAKIVTDPEANRIFLDSGYRGEAEEK
ncbi:gliding motility protein GldB-related protein [Aquirufa sp. A-Brett2-W8]